VSQPRPSAECTRGLGMRPLPNCPGYSVTERPKTRGDWVTAVNEASLRGNSAASGMNLRPGHAEGSAADQVHVALPAPSRHGCAEQVARRRVRASHARERGRRWDAENSPLGLQVDPPEAALHTVVRADALDVVQEDLGRHVRGAIFDAHPIRAALLIALEPADAGGIDEASIEV
jgi:hypothetical protein